MSKRALITGITGQDGSYLAEHLLDQGYQVWGLCRGQANPRKDRIAKLIPELSFVDGDLMDQGSLVSAVDLVQPDEVYNLGAISFVPMSWQQPELVTEVNGTGVLRMLEAVRIVSGLTKSSGGSPRGQIRFYQASSSEMFGKVRESPQVETTPFYPRSPYGCAKVFGHDITVNYRDSYGLFACSGILFNHESPRRGIEFVTRKVTNAVARIRLGLQDKLVLGDLEPRRDWGFAGDYVKAMWMMLQQDEPDDYVVATGETHSVREFVDAAFRHVGLDDWERYVTQDERFFRPAEVDLLVGDATKARTKLGWKPEVDFHSLVAMMVDHDLKLEAKKAGIRYP